MKKIIFILLLLIMPSAYADWFYNSDRIIVDMDIRGSADIIKTSSNGYVETASVNLTFFPKNTDTQEIIDYNTAPDAELSEEILRFTWKRPENEIIFSY